MASTENWIGPALLSAVLLALLVYGITSLSYQDGITGTVISAKEVAISLFGPYVLAVELASLLLLAGLVVAFHVGRDRTENSADLVSNAKAKAEEQ